MESSNEMAHIMGVDYKLNVGSYGRPSGVSRLLLARLDGGSHNFELTILISFFSCESTEG
jgi:hypothetical protein